MRRRTVTAAMLLSIAGLSQAARAAGPQAHRIILDTSTLTSPAMAGRATGLFKDAFAKLGVAVDYTQLLTSSQELEGLVSSSADIVELGYVGVATGAAARVPFTVIGAASNGGGDLLLAHKDSPVRSIAELNGRTVAITKGSSAWALLLRALDKEGMAPSAVKMINLQPDEGQNAFLTNQVDAWAVWSGSKTDAVNAGNSLTLITGEEIGLIPGQIAVRNGFLEQNPALVVAYLRARQQALQRLIEGARAQTLDAIGAARKIAPEKVEAFMKISAPANAVITDGQITDLQRTADLLYKLGEIRRQVVIKDMVNNRFMQEALAAT
jgi:sulfonate transport system substrate-binding protein